MTELLDLPHRRATTLLSSGAPVYLLVNPVEYHGPHLSLHNDRLVSMGLVWGLHARLAEAHDWPLLVAADLEMGVEPVPGPGSRPVSFGVVRQAVRGACRALRQLGATKVVLMTFHGAPLHSIALQAGADELSAAGVRAFCPMNMLLDGLVNADGAFYDAVYATIADQELRARLRASMATDVHAGFLETSVAMVMAPAGVSDAVGEVPPCPEVTPDVWLLRLAALARRLGREDQARQAEFAAYGVGWGRLRPFPGYSGAPHVANTAAGELLVDDILTQGAVMAEAIFAGEAENPRPLAEWLARATLGGRLGPTPVPVDQVGLGSERA